VVLDGGCLDLAGLGVGRFLLDLLLNGLQRNVALLFLLRAFNALDGLGDVTGFRL